LVLLPYVPKVLGGLEPTGANAMAQSLALGERVVLSCVDAFADGVGVEQVGAGTFRLCQDFFYSHALAFLEGLDLLLNWNKKVFN
jgi:threonine dehydratase